MGQPEKAWKKNERRRYCRIGFTVYINCDYTNKMQSRNLSEQGIGVITDQLFEVDTYLNLSFVITEELQIQTYAKVMWSRQTGDNEYACGMQFWHMSAGTQQKIHDYIETRIKEEPELEEWESNSGS